MTGFTLDKSNREKRGDKYFFVYSFDKAIESYTSTKELTIEGQRRLAASYDNMHQNMLSEAAYLELINFPEGVLPEDYYNYAMILKTNGKYNESNKAMDKFNLLKPNDLRAKDYVANKGEVMNLLKDDGTYNVSTLNFNTNADNFGPAYYKDKIVFASSGDNPKASQKKCNWTGKPCLNLYVAELEGTQLKEPELFDENFSRKMNDGPASFSNEGNFMAFTRNHYDLKKKERVVRIEISFSSYVDGEWTTPEPFVLNNKEYSVGHPSLTEDGNTMYFASDMPGGFGGVDIYKITRNESGDWGKAVNMGDKINTEGDEMFPFYKENNKILFFASDGRFGLGGLDIFIAEIKGSNIGSVKNPGAPLNTKSDDYAVIVNDEMTKGYFSSNRSGGGGGDDIYSFDILDESKQIKGIAMEEDGSSIPGTFITLLDEKCNVIDTITTKNDAAYLFKVEADRKYKLTGKKENYIDAETDASTFVKEMNIIADVTLLRKKEVVVKDAVVKDPVVKKPVASGEMKIASIYFDLDKYNIRPDAKVGLDKVVKMMNDNPEMVVEYSSHTDCRASHEYNQTLSDNRAAVTHWYIKTRITNPERIYGKGYGETMPVNGCSCEHGSASRCTKEEFQEDRRTDFIIVSNNKSKESDKRTSLK